jgi:chromosome segregation ATPase
MIITCSQCYRLVDYVSRALTINAPFVCDACASVGDEEVDRFYRDMAPAKPQDPIEPTEEFATVENTTLLIADLEKQLKTSDLAYSCLQRDHTGLLAHVKGLGADLTRAEEHIAALTSLGDFYHDQLKKTREELTINNASLNFWCDSLQKTLKALDAIRDDRDYLGAENTHLSERVTTQSNIITRWGKELETQAGDIRKLKDDLATVTFERDLARSKRDAWQDTVRILREKLDEARNVSWYVRLWDALGGSGIK